MQKLTSLSPVIAIVAFTIAIIAIIILIIQNSKLKGMICRLEARSKTDHERLEHEFENLKTQLKSMTPKNAAPSSAPVMKNDGSHAKPSAEESKPQPVVDKPKDVERTLYASSYDSKRNLFFAIESSPSQKTIYEITYFESNPQVGYFTIYNKAEKKVVECRDHLDAASEIEGRGKRIDWNTLNPGKLQKKDNNWEVVTPLTVKFV